MNNKYFVTYEQAIALKKLGFDLPVNHYYSNNQLEELVDGSTSNYDNCNSSDYIDSICSAPTLEQAHAWIRNKGLLIVPYSMSFENWQYRICRKGKSFKESTLYEDLESFEDALSFGISECLKLIKDEKK